MGRRLNGAITDDLAEHRPPAVARREEPTDDTLVAFRTADPPVVLHRMRGFDLPIQDGLRFLTALAQAGPRDAFYVRMTHWAAPHAWDVSVKPMDLAMFDETIASSFAMRLMQVCFPVSDLPEIHRRIDRYEAGELVPPAATDWTTVGRR
jgi:hypothetical protein